MSRKEEKVIHRAGDIFPMYQGDQDYYGVKIKVKACTIVYLKKATRGLCERKTSVNYTGSSPRFPLCSHYLVHSKNNYWFVGIQPLLEQNIIKIFLWWYLFSKCYFKRDQVLLYAYVIYTRYENINYFISVSMTMYFWSNYISVIKKLYSYHKKLFKLFWLLLYQ